MTYYSNDNIEEFDRFVEHLGFNYHDSIAKARNVYLKLENFIFPPIPDFKQQANFSNHDLSTQELNLMFNKLLSEFAVFEADNPNQKQYRFLSIDMRDVKSNHDQDLYEWSYYNHKFAASQGQDAEAMNKWHQLEESINVNKIAAFKAIRENNMSFFVHVIKNHLFFDEIIFTGINPQIKNEVKYGLDIAEESYLSKLIKEHHAQGICRTIDYGLGSPLLNLIRNVIEGKAIKLNGHILSNSRKLDKYLLLNIRNIFTHLGVNETSIEKADFVFLVNDLDLLSVIPEVNTEKPIFTVDLSQGSTPNYSYLLLKDEGFEQIHSYAKIRTNERPVDTMVRSICAGLMSFIMNRKFVEQLALNYMDDYFTPLASSLGKTLKDFQGPIDMLTKKLEANA